jgi:protein-S-isoprenylcysteine O-methyltransferase Ste14
MMVRLGNFLFRYRNGFFPLAYAFIFAKTTLLFEDYRLAALVGLLIALIGQLLRFATIGLDYIVRGGRNRQIYANDLVTGGLFSHCRNPLYVGNYLILVGVGVASCSAVFLFVILPLMAVAYWAIIAAEEAFLRAKFGEAFDAYCARVSRLLFTPRGLISTLHGMEFHWARVVVKEYGTTFAWTVGYILVVMQNAWLSGDAGSSSPITVSLSIALGVVIVVFLVSRFLKKREIIRG